MVYVFTQITVLSNRVMRLTQELAIRTARRDGDARARAAVEPAVTWIANRRCGSSTKRSTS